MPQLTFIPWLRVDAEERFGPVTLLPKDAGLGQLDGHDRAYTAAMCAAYRELHANKDGEHPEAPITFIRYRDEPLTAMLTDAQFSDVGRALRVLGAVAQPSSQGDFVPANAFVPYAQRYVEGSFSLALAAGRVLSGGLDVRKARFHRPPAIPARARLAIRLKTLRDSAERLVLMADPGADGWRILRSLEWYFWAHLDHDEQNPYVPFVLLVTAFESALNLERSTARGFAKAVGERLATPEDVAKTKQVGQDEVTMNEQGWWALEFYRLRSDAVHGTQVAPDAHLFNGRSHFELGEHAFGILMQQELHGLGLLDLPLGALGRAALIELLRSVPEGA